MYYDACTYTSPEVLPPLGTMDWIGLTQLPAVVTKFLTVAACLELLLNCT